MNLKKQKGFIITYILIFGAVFLIMLSALLGFILAQLKQAKHELNYEQALHIAEAGLSRYRWYLVHKSQELLTGEEIGCPPSDCLDCEPCEYEYSLPGIGIIGKYRLEVDEVRPCDITTAVSVVSTGWTLQDPNADRKIRVRYIKPTVAEYSYILNHNLWAMADRIITGPYHSNGGIRMDGSNNSLVTSEQEEWVCTDSYGCSPCPNVCHYEGSSCVCPGVFTTANGNEELFRTGVSHFDFEGITVDMGNIKKLTQPLPEGEGKGLYLPPSNEGGYHVIINRRDVEVRVITELSRVYAYSIEEGYHWEYSIISEEGPGVEYSLGDCGLIFVEDNVWLEAEGVEEKITLAVADLITPGTERDVWLKDDITYKTGEAPDGFVLVGQHNVLIAPDAPDDLDLDGTFIAQTGHFGMNFYPPWYYPNYAYKEELRIFGTIVSNGRVGTRWTSGGSYIAGYRQRENIYDPDLSFEPPPFLPCISDEFGYRGWEETE